MSIKPKEYKSEATGFYVKLAEWLVSDDGGVSSNTMASIALGARKGDFDAPHDPADFGRCYRLLKSVPEVRLHFDRIGELVPEFKEILSEWDSLVAVYERDKSTNRSDELYDRIKSLRGDYA